MDKSEKYFYENVLKQLIEDHTVFFDAGMIESDLYAKTTRHMMILGLKKFIQKVERGIQILIEHGDWEDNQLCAEMLLQMQHNPDALLEDLGVEFKNPAEILGVASARVDVYHARVQDLIDKESYQDASCVALLLVTLTPQDTAAWIAYGVAEQLAGRLVAGALAFIAAVEIGGELTPLLYSAKAMLQAGFPDAAVEMLEQSLDAMRGKRGMERFEKAALELLQQMARDVS